MTSYRFSLITMTFGAVLAASCGSSSTSVPITAPAVPEAIKAPAGEEVLVRYKATGVQIYTCKLDTATSMHAWSLKAPDAVLLDFDTGAQVGTHSMGPTWTSADGSSVVGMLVARADAPVADAVPWLLLGAASHAGSGVFADITSIQRVDTTGGKAPATGCDAAHDAAEQRVDYTANYYFYVE